MNAYTNDEYIQLNAFREKTFGKINNKKRELRIDPKKFNVTVSGFDKEEIKELMIVDIEEERYLSMKKRSFNINFFIKGGKNLQYLQNTN